MTDDQYRYTTEVAVRLRDLDPMGHVNNGVYATYLEEAREAYFREVLGKSLLDDLNTVTATQTIEYVTPIDSGCRLVDIGVRVADIGEKSLTMNYEIRTENDVAATGSSVQVAYDTSAGTSRPVPAEWREAVVAHERE